MGCFYILEIKPLSVASSANIFFQSVGCLLVLCLILLYRSFQVWLDPICLFLLRFLLPGETNLRKHWNNLGQKMFCLCHLLGVLWCQAFYLSLQAIVSLFLCTVWGSALTSLIYLWLSNFSNTTCWRKCLSIWSLASSIKHWLQCDHYWNRCVDLFLGSLFSSIDSYVCFCTNKTMLFLITVAL